MADIFSVTAPLVVRDRSGNKHLMVERFPHPDGLLYFEVWWPRLAGEAGDRPGIHVLSGPIKGEGPWKVGEHVVTLLSCGDPELSMEWDSWRTFLCSAPPEYSDAQALRERARRYGAQV